MIFAGSVKNSRYSYGMHAIVMSSNITIRKMILSHLIIAPRYPWGVKNKSVMRSVPDPSSREGAGTEANYVVILIINIRGWSRIFEGWWLGYNIQVMTVSGYRIRQPNGLKAKWSISSFSLPDSGICHKPGCTHVIPPVISPWILATLKFLQLLYQGLHECVGLMEEALILWV